MLERWPVQQSSAFMLSRTDTTRISCHCLLPLVSCLHRSGPAIIYIACATAASYTKAGFTRKTLTSLVFIVPYVIQKTEQTGSTLGLLKLLIGTSAILSTSISDYLASLHIHRNSGGNSRW